MYKVIGIKKDLFLLKYGGKTWPTSSNIIVIADKDGLNIIDTGLNKENCLEGLRSCLVKLGFQLSHIHTVILTHGHTDHIAGTQGINGLCNPRILLPERSIPEAIDPAIQEHVCLPSSVREISLKLKDYDILGNFLKTCGEWRLDRDGIVPLRDGDELELGQYKFQAMYAPGHDIGLMVFYEPNIKLLLSTDLLQSAGPGSGLPWYSSAAGGPQSYLESLHRVERLPVNMVFPSHGMLTESLGVAAGHTRDAILGREAEIVACLKSGPKTCDELDSILFRPLLLELCPWYASVTESHLAELEGNGVVKRDGLQWVCT